MFSLALKRTVLGLDASETIGIFLDEAGRTLVGDGSIDPSLPEPHFWELPPALTGKVTDDSVLSERDGSVGWMAQEAIRRADRFESIVGKRLGPIQTLARSKEEYLAAARSSAEGFEALTTASHELLRQIDATDGIDQAEHGLVRRFGVNVHARSNDRSSCSWPTSCWRLSKQTYRWGILSSPSCNGSSPTWWM